jgi:hypothetical protein
MPELTLLARQSYPWYIIKQHATETYGELRYISIILNPGTRWRRVVSFTPPQLYPQGNGTQYSFISEAGSDSEPVTGSTIK